MMPLQNLMQQDAVKETAESEAEDECAGCRQPIAGALSTIADHGHEHVPEEFVKVVGTRLIVYRSSQKERRQISRVALT
jgi:RNA-binding protein YhbY